MEEKLTFEQAIAKLEDIVNHLESGEISLNDSISAFERGMKLQKFCEDTLLQAKMRLAKIIEDNGKVRLESIEANDL